MEGVTLLKRELFNIYCEKDGEGETAKRRYTEKYVLGKMNQGGDEPRACAETAVRRRVRTFCTHLQQKLNACHKIKPQFLKKNAEWLDSPITFEGDSPSPNKRGRPKVELEDASRETNRKVSKNLRSSNSASTLLLAASQQYRVEGNEACAKLLKHVRENPDDSGQLLSTIKRSETGNEKTPTPLNQNESLAFLMDGDFSKSQYQLVRNECKYHNVNIFPSHQALLAAKKNAYPPPNSIMVTDTKAEIVLQKLLDHDCRRIFEYLETETDLLPTLPDKTTLIFYHKWGVDGSGNHSAHQHCDADASLVVEESVLFTAISALQLKTTDNNCEVLWKNPSPSSVRFCKPKGINFKKENNEAILEESDVLEQIKKLEPTTLKIADKTFVINHKLEMTMIDGKTRAFLTDTKSFSTCCICGATPKKMSQSDALSIKESAFKYGISPFHCRIRFLECVLNISYRLNENKWAVSPDKIAARKREVQENVKRELGILVDVVKQGHGNTNCGNTSRRFFAEPAKASTATGCDEKLIEMLGMAADAMAATDELDIEKLRLHLQETEERYQQLYGWYYMPSSVHMVLKHGADILSHMELPMGVYSEEALESRNKDIRFFREHRTRKMSKVSTMEDLMYRLLLSGDLLLSSSR